MRKLWSTLALLTLAATLAGCGGDTNAFVPSSGGSSAPATSTVAKLSVASSAATLPPDGSVQPTITVTATDANNVAVDGAAVTFATSAGTLAVTAGTTGANGQATATLSAQNVAVGTVITVTATAGSASGKTTLTVANTQQTLTLLTSAPGMPSDNSKPATITAVLRNASNQLVPGATVSFSASSGAITPASAVTDSNGSATATLSTPGDQTDRTITVTATVGSTTNTVNVSVVGTSLILTGPSSLILNSTPGTFNVSLTDSGNNGIPGATIKISSASGNMLTPASVVTDPTGHATFTMTGTVAGPDTITVSGLGLTAATAVSVSNQSFAFNPSSVAPIALNTPQSVSVVWKSGGVPVATGSTITFSTTRGYFGGNPAATTTTATTDATGTATVSVSSTTAGPAIITASATGVTTALSTSFIATVPYSIAVQANPATIPTSGQSTIQAVVRDVNNNLVTGQLVDFQLTDTTGGTISVATATTDIQGRAQTVYTATSTASSSNGVLVQATVDGHPSITSTVDLTVGGQTVILSLGTGSIVNENQAETQFSVPFVIQALDSGGNPVPNVTVTLTVHSLPPDTAPPAPTPVGPDYTTTSTYAAYAKGIWVVVPSATPPWVQQVAATCLNEDVDGTGIYSASEDLNGNGILDPGDVAAVSPGSVVTDSTGTANVNVTYPEDHALWVQVRLTATATVSGTESTTTSTFWLPMLASKLTTATVNPPGITSPYGKAASCASPF